MNSGHDLCYLFLSDPAVKSTITTEYKCYLFLWLHLHFNTILEPQIAKYSTYKKFLVCKGGCT